MTQLGKQHGVVVLITSFGSRGCWFEPTQLLFSFAKSQLAKPKVTQRIKRASKEEEKRHLQMAK